MSYFSIQFAALAAGLTLNFFAVSAFAQTPPPHANESSGNVAAAATPFTTTLRYDSVFGRYHSYRDEKIGVWRGANETVERVGGWRAYAREAQQPDSNAPAKLDPHAIQGAKP